VPRWWLDLGSGMEAEWWRAEPVPPGVRVIAVDPLLTNRMVQSGRPGSAPAGVERVGAELDGARGGLPFRDAVFERILCAFMLHLYLSTLDQAVQEFRRLLLPGGEAIILLPHLGDGRSEEILFTTRRRFAAVFGDATLELYSGPLASFWADLYRGRTWQVVVQST